MPATVDHEEVAAHKFGCVCAPCKSYDDELRIRLKRRFRTVARSQR